MVRIQIYVEFLYYLIMQPEPTQIFQEDDLIGKGTFGEVYKIFQNGKWLVEKRIKKSLISGYGRVRQLCREVQILKKMKHENVVQFVDFYTTDHHYILKMEYCEGYNLKSLLQSSQYRKTILNNNPKYFATKISLDLLHALIYIRNSLVSNRDIKLDNLIVSIDKDSKVSAKVIDFGEAKFHIRNATSTVGTLSYMAPQVHAGQNYTETCDDWSFGMILYEIFEGIRQQWEQNHISCPFWESFRMKKPNFVNFYNNLIWEQGISLTKSRTPKPFRQIIRGLLNPDPSRRMNFKKIIQILIDSLQNDEELKSVFNPAELERQRVKLIQSLALEKNTNFVKGQLSECMEQINELYNSLLIPISKTLSERRFGRNLGIVKLMKALIDKINQNLYIVIDKMQVDPEYVFYQILTDVMNGQKKQHFKDLMSCIQNHFKLLKIDFNSATFKISPDMELYIASKFEMHGQVIMKKLKKYF